MNQDRRLAVLGAIVRDYVHTSEPVGSKMLVERHNLGVSAATVRNDMAALEEAGLIHAPHTSAGRVPTDAGYRMFVDRLGAVKPLTVAERAAIERFLAGALDLDDVIDRTVRLLAGLTRQVAVMQYPSLTRSAVRHIEVVPLGGARLMIVLIVSSGRVEQRIVNAADPGDPGGIDSATVDLEILAPRLRTELNAICAGRPFSEATSLLQSLPERFDPADRDCVRLVVRALDEVLVEEREERVVLAGTSNLARFGADFPHTIGPVLSALEEHVVLLRLLGTLGADPETIAVRIGHENEHEGLAATSVITTGYGPGQVQGGLGVLGPTRMDYPTTMAHVRAVARYVSELLEP